MAKPPLDITDFTNDQFNAFQRAAELGSGVQVTDNGNNYLAGGNNPIGYRTSDSINSSTLASTPSLNFKSPTETNPYPVAGLNQTPDLQMTAPEQKAQGEFDALAELNKQLLGQSAEQATQEQNFGIPEQMKAQNELSSRLKALQNEALAIPLQLQQEATGRGVTEGGLRPHQTAALRNNAIQALSVNSLLEASRGNLTLAQDMADRAVAQKFDPIKERIAVAKANLDLILQSPAYSLADKNRAQRQKDIQDQKARDLQKQQDNEKAVLAWQAEAIKNHPEASFQIQQATGRTPQEALAILGAYLIDPVQARKDLDAHLLAQAQIDKYNAETAATNADAKAKSGGTVASAETYNERSSTINLINNILSNPELGYVVGLGKLNPLTYLPGQANQAVRAQVQQVIAKLALDNRAKLKGSGAVSDFESKTLERSGSAFSTDLSYEGAQKALKQVRGALTTMNGGTATVKVTDKNGQTVDAEANTDAINKMIADGLQVEYQ